MVNDGYFMIDSGSLRATPLEAAKNWGQGWLTTVNWRYSLTVINSWSLEITAGRLDPKPYDKPCSIRRSVGVHDIYQIMMLSAPGLMGNLSRSSGTVLGPGRRAEAWQCMRLAMRRRDGDHTVVA